MREITIKEQPITERFCPCIAEPSDACYCTKMESQYVDKMLYFCCNNFESCEIFKNKFF
jgi:hypothetical protein